jgi:hypothetical protein
LAQPLNSAECGESAPLGWGRFHRVPDFCGRTDSGQEDVVFAVARPILALASLRSMVAGDIAVT